jgi:hypothetical protein
MIFMGQRRAEQGKDAIAQRLRHIAIIYFTRAGIALL